MPAIPQANEPMSETKKTQPHSNGPTFRELFPRVGERLAKHVPIQAPGIRNTEELGADFKFRTFKTACINE